MTIKSTLNPLLRRKKTPSIFRGGKEKFKFCSVKIYGVLEFFYFPNFYFNILGRKDWFLEIRNERVTEEKVRRDTKEK